MSRLKAMLAAKIEEEHQAELDASARLASWGGGPAVTLTVATSTCRTFPGATSSAVTVTPLAGPRAWSTPSGVTHTFVVSLEVKVGAGRPAIGWPKASRGVAVSCNVLYGGVVSRVMARWFSVRRHVQLLGREGRLVRGDRLQPATAGEPEPEPEPHEEPEDARARALQGIVWIAWPPAPFRAGYTCGLPLRVTRRARRSR